MMKKLFLLLAFLILCACSDKDVAGISTVETENAFLIRVVHENSMPASNVVARVRSADFVRNVVDDSTETSFFKEYKTDSLGCIRMDSLDVDTAMIEIIDKGEGVVRKIAARDVQEGDSVQFVLEKTGSLHGKVYLPEGVDFAWIQVYGTDRLVKTDSRGFYEMDSLAPYDEYGLQIIIGDTVVQQSAEVKIGGKTSSNVYAFEPDSVKVLDFEMGKAEFVLEEFDLRATGYLMVTDTSVVTVPAISDDASDAVEHAGAGREGKALHWKSSAGFGVWSIFGIWICTEKSPCDLTELDSVVYYVRGTGHYSFAFEALGKTNVEGKTLTDDTLDVANEWKRVCVKPSDFIGPDSSWGNFGWDAVKKTVTTISILAYDEAEIWIDDITLYGIKPSEFAAK
ncbi:hypothetical protein [Fibrobacter sp.]|uniref:hypothetical protein n=1 Tax=Fibrobacter sp. TaxID=35828 RepID=UPI0025C22DA9|nr:hypothetical protein [Fibrobacter sp.]MBR3070702.1 hypothetical protein [Fibrobacter sp.]